MSILKVEGLHKVFQQAQTPIEVLRGIELEMNQGETVAILGKSGSGKTTLLSLIAGMDHASQGKVLINGTSVGDLSERDLTEFRARNLGIIFQQFHLMPGLTALENVMLPLEIARAPDAESLAVEALKRVELDHRPQHFPHMLSGGEKQRVAIARAIVMKPKLLLADEPSGYLDNETGNQTMDLLFDLVRDQGMTMLLVTHSEELARQCGRQLFLKAGIFS